MILASEIRQLKFRQVSLCKWIGNNLIQGKVSNLLEIDLRRLSDEVFPSASVICATLAGNRVIFMSCWNLENLPRDLTLVTALIFKVYYFEFLRVDFVSVSLENCSFPDDTA